MSIYSSLEKFLPKKYTKSVEQNLRYAGLELDAREFSGFTFFFSLNIALLVFFILEILGSETLLLSLVGALLSFFLSMAVFNLLLIYVADKRASFCERVLPDVLLLTASNIRAGMPPDEAFLSSAREEFGPFSQEIIKAGKKIMSGHSFESAFGSISENIKSKKVESSIMLILDGIRSGGEIAKLLEETANDLRSMESLQKIVSSNVRAYILFIFFAAGFGAPLLYGMSTFLIETMVKLGKTVELPEVTVPGAPSFLTSIRFSSINVDPEFFVHFALGAMTISSFFGGIAMGLIEKGSQKAGVRYIPALLLLNFLIFFLVRKVVSSLLSGMAI